MVPAGSYGESRLFVFKNKNLEKSVTFSCYCADWSGDQVRSRDKCQLQNDDASSCVTDPKCCGASQRTMILLLGGWLCLCPPLVKQT